MAPDRSGTPPLGVIALFKEVKEDLRTAVERDEREHKSLNESIEQVRGLNVKQSESLRRIETVLGTKQLEKTERGKTLRTTLKVVGPILALIIAAVIGHYLGK